MISYKTLNEDNPKLNCRLDGQSKFSPKRIILDNNLEMKISSYIFRTANKDNTVIFYNKANKTKVSIFKKKGIQLIRSNLLNNENFDIKSILKKLYILGCRNLLVEGGNVVLEQVFLKITYSMNFIYLEVQKTYQN